MFYLSFTVLQGKATAIAISFEQMDDLLRQSQWQLGFLALIWTCVFSVKWCYYAFFHPMMRAMSKRFVFWYRFCIVFSVVCWAFIIAGEQTIICPYIGKDSGTSTLYLWLLSTNVA
jgi:hypothetical protein